MDGNEKKYNLNLKGVLIYLSIVGLYLLFFYWFLFIMSDDEKKSVLLNFHTTTLLMGRAPIIGGLYIAALCSLLIFIYFFEVLIFKTKNILIIDESGITYYAPELKKVFIPKDKIKEIYINDRNQMKIVLNNYEIKKGFRAIFWTFLKDIYLGGNPQNVFRINLGFIDCDVIELRRLLLQFNLDSGGNEANQIIKNVLQQYNYKSIEELKKDEKALEECIINLYNTEKFTQAEVSAFVGISTNKVSKIIRKNLK